MKKALKFALSGFLFFMPFFIESAIAQRLYFCDSVSVNGDPVGLNQQFFIPQEGANIAMLIKLPSPVEATQVELRFFKADSLNNEMFLSTVAIDVQTSWTWFWKEINFTLPAHYKVYVYADKERFICSETVDVYMR